MASTTKPSILKDLNAQQREAVQHGDSPLLIIAGAGTGKTMTLVHRVAYLIDQGMPPHRILLLTFTRRAAAEMLRRVDHLLGTLRGDAQPHLMTDSPRRRVWGGTFHAIAARLLRIHGKTIGLSPNFTIHDRSDSEDLIDVARKDLGFAKADRSFPKKGTCMAIYSYTINAQTSLDEVLEDRFEWCWDYGEELEALFEEYTKRKEANHVLDYDDLLLFFRTLLDDGIAGPAVRDRFDAALVDEYQDTNLLQADILLRLCPDGHGLTAVGDDAQSIYSFRAATVRNILDFPKQFPGSTVIKLEQNYRSRQPILTATNAVIMEAREQYAKELRSDRDGGETPWLVGCHDDADEAEFVAQRILEHREQGIALRDQAVLFRASHNSSSLETELARRGIPFVKYGGLRFVESAHIKDVLAILRLAENARDVVAGTRVLKLLPGIGPKTASQLLETLIESDGNFKVWHDTPVPAATKERWGPFVRMMVRLQGNKAALISQLRSVAKFYRPMIAELYDNPRSRRDDVNQLVSISERFKDRQTMLAELALDPPTHAGEARRAAKGDTDRLTLSTIHSAKGMEWKVVYVIEAIDGMVPFYRAAGDASQLEEERRLFYVALTRAKDWLYVCHPQILPQSFYSNPYMAQFTTGGASRFLTKRVKKAFQAKHSIGQVSW